jgi:hypothetical protein
VLDVITWSTTSSRRSARPVAAAGHPHRAARRPRPVLLSEYEQLTRAPSGTCQTARPSTGISFPSASRRAQPSVAPAFMRTSSWRRFGLRSWPRMVRVLPMPGLRLSRAGVRAPWREPPRKLGTRLPCHRQRSRWRPLRMSKPSRCCASYGTTVVPRWARRRRKKDSWSPGCGRAAISRR